MEEADKHTIRTLLRRDTSNLMLVTSLAVVVVSRAAQEGWRREDAVYMTVLGALTRSAGQGSCRCECLKCRDGTRPPLPSSWWEGTKQLRRIPGMKAP